MLFSLCLIVLTSAILLGGGTHSGFLGDVIVQFFSIPLFVVAVWPAFDIENAHRHAGRVSLSLAGIVLILVLAQTTVLPFLYWQGSDFASFSEASASRAIPALSVTPQLTWAAAASMLAALSVFAGTSLLSHRQRMHLCWAVLALGSLSLIAGFLQFAQGPGSALRFYAFTNQTEAVGFFANRNHFAALLYITLIFAAVWFGTVSGGSLHRKIAGARSLLWLTASAGLLIAVVAGLAMARSRAGLVLAIVSLAGIVAMTSMGRRAAQSRHERPRGGRASLAIAVFAVLFSVQFGLGAILTRFERDPLEDLRIPLALTTAETALRSMPTGTGLGSFVTVYGASEKEGDIFSGFANRAHNDLVEFVLETGLAGVAMLVIFFAWFTKQAFRIWISPSSVRHPSETYLERAAVLGVCLLILHSLVDYPLRTAALSTLFAFLCGILAFPAPYASERNGMGTDRKQPRKIARLEKWGAGAAWPEIWR